ncbi:hypothetical protein P9281_27610 [Caballeronia sp. LP003]|uniref:hypothetical protein n=1 Tax=Caballeronia sp. LP003 TaxID=3038551 RepID=UPI00285E85DC|nr:hypothetical protein [Caballeronia sp. LP003]MDR5790318.1 hypothetical protein [Caballeronia sp. LP003]
MDGQPATLAVIDASGHIVESGPEVVDEVWDVTVEAYRRFLIGANALQVVSTPQGMFGEKLLD